MMLYGGQNKKDPFSAQVSAAGVSHKLRENLDTQAIRTIRKRRFSRWLSSTAADYSSRCAGPSVLTTTNFRHAMSKSRHYKARRSDRIKYSVTGNPDIFQIPEPDRSKSLSAKNSMVSRIASFPFHDAGIPDSP
jgi:hypothetical protein